MEETKIDKLRNELIKLREERSRIIFEKGMAAEENKDLRENFVYDYWYEKECQVNGRISHIRETIYELSNKDKPSKAPKVNTKPRKIEKIKGNYEPHKWL